MNKRDARRKLVLDTIERAFRFYVPGKVNLMEVDLVKKRLKYKENTPIGNLPREMGFNITTKEVVIAGKKMAIGDRSMIANVAA